MRRPEAPSDAPAWRDPDAPPFAEPWQAQAFALTVQLHQAGHFNWREWADTLAAVLAQAAAADPADDSSAYYGHWLTALERLTDAKQLSNAGERANRKQAWKTAYATTAHGKPVALG